MVAVVIDKYCAPLLAEGQSYLNSPQSLLYRTSRPTVYVLMALGGSSPAGGASKGGGGGSGGGGGGGSASSAVDNPSGLLLYMIAQRLQNSICRADARLRGDSSAPTPGDVSRDTVQQPPYVSNSTPLAGLNDNRNGRVDEVSNPCISGSTADPKYSIPTLAVVPETQWTAEDFRNQCVGDPYVAKDGETAPHGTVAGILLNGAITTRDGAFRLFTVTGGSEAQFGAELVGCEKDASPGPATNVTLWTDLISSGTTSQRISLFPFALAGAITAANLTAKATYNTNPATGATAATGASLAAAQTAFQQTNTSLAVGQAIGQFAQGLGSMTFGNPSSALSLRRTFANWATEFNEHLVVFCQSQQANPNLRLASGGNVCRYLGP